SRYFEIAWRGEGARPGRAGDSTRGRATRLSLFPVDSLDTRRFPARRGRRALLRRGSRSDRQVCYFVLRCTIAGPLNGALNSRCAPPFPSSPATVFPSAGSNQSTEYVPSARSTMNDPSLG